MIVGSRVDDLKICNGWAYNPNTKKCYKNVRKRILFTEARNECKMIARRNAKGALITKVDLASVHNAQENNFLDGLMGPTRSAWLGAVRLPNKQWAWTDGSEWDYTNWIKGRGRGNGGRDFVMMAWNGEWNDIVSVGLGLEGYICQYLNINQFTG